MITSNPPRISPPTTHFCGGSSARIDAFRVGRLSFLGLLIGLVLAGPGARVDCQTVHLPLVTGTIAARMPDAQRRQTPLTPVRPPLVKKVPADLIAARYALIEMGPIEQKTFFVAMLEEVEGREPRLIVDGDHDGDLTNDLPVVWKKTVYTDFAGKRFTRREGNATLHLPCGKTSVDLPLHFIRDDPQDPNAGVLRDLLQYLPDYDREGTLKLGTETYSAALFDVMARGDFRGNVSSVNSGTLFLIDVNHNGRIDPRGELYDIGRPFNIKGVTYELHVLVPDGSALEIVKSKKSVPEILPPPDLSAGQPCLPFAAETLQGTKIHFPTDYKSKKVLLYFWASWCPYCKRQNPFVVKAYRKYHVRGLEVLGISIDQPDQKEQVIAFTRANEMAWPQIYDGKFWQNDLVQLYFVSQTPTPLLIDAATGKILAGREELLFDKLDSTLGKFFPPKSAAR